MPEPTVIHGGVYQSQGEPSIWSKIGSVLKNVGTIAAESLPYLADAAAAGLNAYKVSGNYSTKTPQSEMPGAYSAGRSIPNPVPMPGQRPLPQHSPITLGRNAVSQAQAKRLPLPKTAEPNPHLLNEVTSQSGWPRYENRREPNEVTLGPQAGTNGRWAVPLSGQNSANGFIQEDETAIQRNLSYANNPQKQRHYSDERSWQNRQNTNTRQPEPRVEQQPSQTAGQALLEQAFYDPRGSENMLLQFQNGVGLSPGQLAQFELNIDRLLSEAQDEGQREKINNIATAGKALFAQSWYKEAKHNPDGTVTYRGMIISQDKAMGLVLADVNHYWNTDTHLGRDPNWQEKATDTGSGFAKGLLNGAVAGGGPKPSVGEEGAYAAGDLMGSLGVNLGALSLGAGAPAVWGAYGAAREANREADLGKNANFGAIASSGALNVVTGKIPSSVPLNIWGKVGTGLATDYASDIANRGVQQLGDTGHLDPSQIDYAPGFGTAFGGAAGLLSSPQVANAFRKYLLNRQQQVLTGQKVSISIEDFIANIQKETGWSDQEMAFYTGKSSSIPAQSPYNREMWSKGPESSRLANAFRHVADHADEFEPIPGQPFYIQAAHDFRNNLPSCTELKITPMGQQIYYHEKSNTILFRNKQGEIQSMYKPDLGREWFDKKPGIYYGAIK